MLPSRSSCTEAASSDSCQGVY